MPNDKVVGILKRLSSTTKIPIVPRDLVDNEIDQSKDGKGLKLQRRRSFEDFKRPDDVPKSKSSELSKPSPRFGGQEDIKPKQTELVQNPVQESYHKLQNEDQKPMVMSERLHKDRSDDGSFKKKNFELVSYLYIFLL